MDNIPITQTEHVQAKNVNVQTAALFFIGPCLSSPLWDTSALQLHFITAKPPVGGEA